MARNLLLLLLLISSFSCKKDEPVIVEDPQPAPELIAAFSRSFFYTIDNISASVTYPLGLIQAKAIIADDKSLVIDFDTPFPGGNDNASIIIPVSKIKAGYTGDYPIQLSSNTETIVHYQYKLSETSANKLLPGSSSGNLKILSYDAHFKTIEGEFSFTITTASDPRSSAINNFRQTTITINGSFKNLAVN
jgi:hypothetical protein